MATRKSTAVTVLTKPIIETTTIAPPNTDDLDARLLKLTPMHGFAVNNAEDSVRAQRMIAERDDVIKFGLSLLDPPCNLANTIHKSFTGLRNFFLATPVTEKEQLSGMVVGWMRREQERVRQEQERQRREEEQRRAAEQERLRLQAIADAEAAAAASPWEEDVPEEQIAETVQAAVAALPPPVQTYAPAPVVETIAGFGFRNKPLSYRVTDKHALIIAAAQGLLADPPDATLAGFLTVDDAATKAQLKLSGELIGQFIPGIESVREQTTSFRG